ncbi:serine hydrolase domain-containing protein [Chryseobacterium populi]|uniref:Penicillin-binding protein, beta-lactamase class C n=1 Tax=Chryseobacterium populi TaxID=1144316 RepID=J2K3V3_9FLAO|nr:serine hydrolase [Chryseobacterium populi]EJL74855.1 penicillin-binding protein, beta-lactamase class C [Chryseobacterium populi]
MRTLFLCILFSISGFISGQAQNITNPDKIELPVQKSNLNTIVFLNKPIPLESIKETDFLTTMVLQEDKDFDIRIFMDNSLANYLHQLDSSLSVDELIKKGNYQFSFYVDGKLIYQENLNPGAGSPESKKVKTTFRIPLISVKNEDSWGRYLWMRFYLGNNGIDALEPGNHIMKIEIRPYLKTGDLKTGNIIAKGEINLVIPEKKVSEQQTNVQPIRPNSGWKISDEKINTEKIKTLNKKIAENRFRDITGIVVVKNNKLLLEEYFSQSGRDSLQDTRSVGKSFASALTGIAIKDGYLKNEDQKISEFYEVKTFKNHSFRKDNVSIKNLLTMSSGFDGNDDNYDSPGNEENMYPTDNWVKFVLDLPMTENTAGKTWAYFTAGVVLAGDILDQSVPRGLENYAHQKLFNPLGINKYQWQYTPQHKVSMAGGLRMRALDFAKFGQVYKNNGTWNGKRIIDQNWIRKSFTNYFSDNKDFDGYGYLFWRKVYAVGNKKFEAFQSSGNGGNKIIIFTELPLVIVITARAYNKPYAHSQADMIVQDYLLPALIVNSNE